MPKIKTTTAFIGVCASALLIIPMVCSAVIKPIMKRIDQNSSNKTKIDVGSVKSPAAKTVKENTFKGLYVSNNYGMKVGGV